MGFMMLDFSKLKILVIGDAMEDVFVYGRTTRKSPEADCQVFEVDRTVKCPGGAANAAANIRALGAQADLVTCVTGMVKTRIVDAEKGHIVRIDTPGEFDLGSGEFYLETFMQNYNYNGILISDYGKGTYKHLRQDFWKLRSKNIPVVVDPKEKDFSVYTGADVIMPNQKEFQEATNLGGGTLLIKKGRQGMMISNHRPTYVSDLHIPGHNVVTKEVSGAGDTAAACVTLMLASGKSLEEAARVANVCAALAVAKEGVATVSIEELNAEIYGPGKTIKPVKRGKTSELVKSKTGFCNGCFDLFHPGHMWFLWQAAQQCEYLTVGLNTDDSVKRLKGSDRPVQCYDQRGLLLQSLHFVGEVVPVDDPDEYLIEKARFGAAPDIVFRGPDQKPPPDRLGINWVRISPPIPIAQYSTTKQLKK